MRFMIPMVGAVLLIAAPGSKCAWAFSEDTLGGAAAGNAARYQDPDNLFNVAPLDTGMSLDTTSAADPTAAATDKSKLPASTTGFSFSGGSNDASTDQPYGAWTIKH